MHPLVHAWAKDRQNSDQQARSWLNAGGIIALSNLQSSLFQWYFQRMLRPHLHSLLAGDLAGAFSGGPEEMILWILFRCGQILLQILADAELVELLNHVFQEYKADPMIPTPLSKLLPFYRLSANHCLNTGRYEEASGLLERIVKIGNTMLPPGHPDRLSSQHDLARAYRRVKRLEEAYELEREVAETMEGTLGPNDPSTLMSETELALILGDRGDYEEAEKVCRRILAVSRRAFGVRHPNTLTTMAALASMLLSQKKLEEAEELNEKILEMRKMLLGAKHPDTLASMANLALTFEHQGRKTEAVELMMECTQLQELVLGAEHPDTLASSANLQSLFNTKAERPRLSSI
ncbi:hypothetical protein A1O3_04338 [Capronia epimyces CBS 606.96]|uniref:MalT-like TPR region domain-containing protein n=1 Tax=Capronia epimyces CBS 606.96 TaxID=1182542 RepID=W9YYM2_9EURO|nr:uncharacterized protein A1O3_04338 [Capronia epimyces CBS 606.96]EXJ87379.1 hypothetical protein A1O3_04338 [Capronia epimyces CBS 606.96]